MKAIRIPTPRYTLGVDIGGTFTDIVLLAADGVLFSRKVLSTPDDYSRAIEEGVTELLRQVEVDADEPEEPPEGEAASSVADTERELVVADSPNNEDDFERLLNMAENLPDDYEERSRPSLNRIEQEGDRRHDAMANMLARPESLTDYLHHQLSWFDVEGSVRRMAERIIYSLDTNGYLKTPLEELLPSLQADANGDAHAHRSKQLEIAEEALRVVQRLDPPGVGAPPPRKSNAWIWILGIVGLLGIGMVVCCGVGGYFAFNAGMGVVTNELKNEVAGDPNIQQHLGEIENLSVDIIASGQEAEKRGRGAQVLVFNAEGSEGKEAKIIAEQSKQPQPGNMFSKIDLRLPSGEEISIK